MSAVVTASLLPDAPRRTRRHEEGDLQRSVHQYLTWALPPDAFHFAIPNGLMRSKKSREIAKGQGVLAGIADLCVIYRGRAFLIELKARRGVLSVAQRAMMRKAEYCDTPFMVCRSLPEVEAQLREACVPLRGRVAA